MSFLPPDVLASVDSHRANLFVFPLSEEPAAEVENVDPKADLRQPSLGKDGPECKMQ